MAQPCKVFSYTNVGTEKGVLANIASAAQAGGWTVDKNAVDADGELYLHKMCIRDRLGLSEAEYLAVRG